MRKVFPLVLSGLLAVSFSQLAAAQSTSVQGGANANVGADVKKGDTGAKSADSASTAASGGSSTGSSTGPGGVNADTQVKGKHKAKAKNRKHKDASGAGSTSSKDKAHASAAAGGSADTSATPQKSEK